MFHLDPSTSQSLYRQAPDWQALGDVLAKKWPRFEGQIKALRVFEILNITDDLAPVLARAEFYRQNTDQVIILGTGGSSLGGQTLLALAGSERSKVIFLDSIDPIVWSRTLAKINPARTGLIVISKSGGTAETLAGLGLFLDHHDPRLVTVITEPRPSSLNQIAILKNYLTLDHDTQIGGRYSVMTNVGLLPAAIAGLDIADLRLGGKEYLDKILADPTPILQAVQTHAYLWEKGIRTHILLPYVDDLDEFGYWHRQLWAESLGKQGFGSLPVPAIGPVDQHSQLQLWLDGPKDKYFTGIALNRQDLGQTTRFPRDIEGLQFLNGKKMGELLIAEQEATFETIKRHHVPFRRIDLDELSMKSMGALMVHFMLETILLAWHWGIDPFDQPAVEEGKILTKQYLAQTP